MLTTVKGHYDGRQIIIDENVNLKVGQEVIVTILDMQKKAIETIDLKQYMGRGKKMFHTDAQEYIKELRSNDRM